MSGVDAQRGFIYQSIIAMLECLERDDWDEVKLEPETKLDKVDIQLYKAGQIITAIQVKSSKKKFSQPDIDRWLKALRVDVPDADRICLYLVGNSYTENCEEYIKKNSDEIKTVSISDIEDLCAGKLTKYIRDIGLAEDVRIADLDYLDASLFSRIHRNSIASEPLSRVAFEEAFRRALPNMGFPRCLTNYIPIGPEIGLIGRDAVINQIQAMLNSEKKIALVSGCGGIGKTAVMQQICNSIMAKGNKDTYVAWITCGDSFIDDLLTLQYSLGISKELGREVAYDAVVRKLQNLHGTLYLFLDDMARVPDRKELGSYNALCQNVRIMITSRHEIKGISQVNLQELEKEHAIEMFYGYYGKDTEKKYIEDAWAIINSVNSHTLLVELLAKAANASFENLTNFRKKLEDEGYLEVSRRRIDTGRFDNKTIQESVMLLYTISCLSPEQQHIMRLFSIFTPEKNIYGAIEEWAGFDIDAIDGLVKLGWIVRTESGFVVHQIIKDSIEEQVGENLRIEDYGNLLERTADIDNYIPKDLEYTEAKERIVLAEDIARFIEKRKARMGDVGKYAKEENLFIEKAFALFNNLANLYEEWNRPTEVIKYRRIIIEDIEKRQPLDFERYIQNAIILTRMHQQIEDFDIALQYIRKMQEVIYSKVHQRSSLNELYMIACYFDAVASFLVTIPWEFSEKNRIDIYSVSSDTDLKNEIEANNEIKIGVFSENSAMYDSFHCLISTNAFPFNIVENENTITVVIAPKSKMNGTGISVRYIYTDYRVTAEEMLYLSVSIKDKLFELEKANYVTPLIETMTMISEVWSKRGLLQPAITNSTKALQLIRFAKEELLITVDNRFEISNHLILCRCFSRIGNEIDAENHLRSAKDILISKKRLYKDKINLAEVYQTLAIFREDFSEAEEYYVSAINELMTIEEELQSLDDRLMLLECYTALCEIYTSPYCWNPVKYWDCYENCRKILDMNNMDDSNRAIICVCRIYLTIIRFEDCKSEESISIVIRLFKIVFEYNIELINNDSDYSLMVWRDSLIKLIRVNDYNSDNLNQGLKNFWDNNKREIFADILTKIENVSIKNPLHLIPNGYRDEISDFALITGAFRMNHDFIDNYHTPLFMIYDVYINTCDLSEHERIILHDRVDEVYSQLMQCQNNGYAFQVYAKEKDLLKKRLA